MAEKYKLVYVEDSASGGYKLATVPDAGYGPTPRRKTLAVPDVTTGTPVTFDEPSVLRCITAGTIVVTAWDGGTDTFVGAAGDVFDFLEIRSIAASGSGTWQRYYY
jgi:hypothetical protein